MKKKEKEEEKDGDKKKESADKNSTAIGDERRCNQRVTFDSDSKTRLDREEYSSVIYISGARMWRTGPRMGQTKATCK